MSRSTKRVAALFGALLSIPACVPASEAPPPAGAAGARLEPSAAARGEPFESDGWRVTVEKLVVRVRINAFGVRSNGYGWDTYIADVMRPAEIFAPGLRVGPARVQVELATRKFFREQGTWDAEWDDAVVLPGVAPDDLRWLTDPVFVTPSSFEAASSASVLVVLRGERGASRVTVRAALEVDSRTDSPVGSCAGDEDEEAGWPPGGDEDVRRPPPPEEDDPVVDVRANDVVYAPFEVRPEEVFRCEVGFGELAAADTNGDGVVDNDELLAAPARSYASLRQMLDVRFGVLLRPVKP